MENSEIVNLLNIIKLNQSHTVAKVLLEQIYKVIKLNKNANEMYSIYLIAQAKVNLLDAWIKSSLSITQHDNEMHKLDNLIRDEIELLK